MELGIVGGGIGGLAAGVALRQIGVQCVVYERDSSLHERQQGFGMTLSSDERGPLARLGILTQCEELNCESRCHWVFDGEGRIRGYFGRGLVTCCQEQKRRGNLRIQRQQLRELLLRRYASLGGIVLWGAKVLSAAQQDQGSDVELTLSDGKKIRHAAVVGADGVRSVIRTLGPPLRNVGVSVVVGLSTYRHSLLDRQGFYVIDGATRLFTMPFSSELTMWQLSFSNCADEPSLELAKRIAHRWRKLHNVVNGLLTATLDVWSTRFVDRDRMSVDPNTASRITVLGDACHPMTCFKGQGANQALSDALTLATCLGDATPDNLPKRLRNFEREMIQRAAPRVEASRQAALFLHSQSVLLEPPAFTGLDTALARRLFEYLDQRGITANTQADLLQAVRGAYSELSQGASHIISRTS